MTTRMPEREQETPAPATRVAIAVVQHCGCFLVGRRAATGTLPNVAEFPGGKCLPGESVVEAAARECFEETGLKVNAEHLLMEVDHQYEHGKLRLTFVECTWTGEGAVRVPFRWVPKPELSGLPFPAANRAVLELLASQI